jgi:hypothetical protein
MYTCMCMYMYTCTHTHTHIYIYIYIYITYTCAGHANNETAQLTSRLRGGGEKNSNYNHNRFQNSDNISKKHLGRPKSLAQDPKSRGGKRLHPIGGKPAQLNHRSKDTAFGRGEAHNQDMEQSINKAGGNSRLNDLGASGDSNTDVSGSMQSESSQESLSGESSRKHGAQGRGAPRTERNARSKRRDLDDDSDSDKDFDDSEGKGGRTQSRANQDLGGSGKEDGSGGDGDGLERRDGGDETDDDDSDGSDVKQRDGFALLRREVRDLEGRLLRAKARVRRLRDERETQSADRRDGRVQRSADRRDGRVQRSADRRDGRVQRSADRRDGREQGNNQGAVERKNEGKLAGGGREARRKVPVAGDGGANRGGDPSKTVKEGTCGKGGRSMPVHENGGRGGMPVHENGGRGGKRRESGRETLKRPGRGGESARKSESAYSAEESQYSELEEGKQRQHVLAGKTREKMAGDLGGIPSEEHSKGSVRKGDGMSVKGGRDKKRGRESDSGSSSEASGDDADEARRGRRGEQSTDDTGIGKRKVKRSRGASSDQQRFGGDDDSEGSEPSVEREQSERQTPDSVTRGQTTIQTSAREKREDDMTAAAVHDSVNAGARDGPAVNQGQTETTGVDGSAATAQTASREAATAPVDAVAEFMARVARMKGTLPSVPSVVKHAADGHAAQEEFSSSSVPTFEEQMGVPDAEGNFPQAKVHRREAVVRVSATGKEYRIVATAGPYCKLYQDKPGCTIQGDHMHTVGESIEGDSDDEYEFDAKPGKKARIPSETKQKPKAVAPAAKACQKTQTRQTDSQLQHTRTDKDPNISQHQLHAIHNPNSTLGARTQMQKPGEQAHQQPTKAEAKHKLGASREYKPVFATTARKPGDSMVKVEGPLDFGAAVAEATSRRGRVYVVGGPHKPSRAVVRWVVEQGIDVVSQSRAHVEGPIVLGYATEASPDHAQSSGGEISRENLREGSFSAFELRLTPSVELLTVEDVVSVRSGTWRLADCALSGPKTVLAARGQDAHVTLDRCAVTPPTASSMRSYHLGVLVAAGARVGMLRTLVRDARCAVEVGCVFVCVCVLFL